MDNLRSAVIGLGDDAPATFMTTTVLNIRKGPEVSHDELECSPLPLDTRVEVMGEYGVWRHVDILEVVDDDSHCTGWVHGYYLKEV